MLEQIVVKSTRALSLEEFLTEHDFFVEKIQDEVITARRSEESPVFISTGESTMFFQVDLGSVAGIATQELYFRLLDLNTEILPVSLGIDTTNGDDPRLVLIESRETVNLDANEVLAVLDAMEIAIDKVAALLGDTMR
jgi:hypothetical protein